MLEYLYTHHFNVPKAAQKDTTLPFCVLVCKLADKYKYLLPALREASRCKFEERAQTVWQTKEFATAMSDIYAAELPIGDTLLATALNIAAKHAKVLLRDKDPCVDFDSASRATPSFGTDLAAALTKTTVG